MTTNRYATTIPRIPQAEYHSHATLFCGSDSSERHNTTKPTTAMRIVAR